MSNLKPYLKTVPHKKQQETYDKFCLSRYFAVFGEPGIGKSKIAIDLAAYHHYRKHIDHMLIIAPNFVHEQWIEEQFPAHCAIDYVPMVWTNSRANYHVKALGNFLTKKSDKLKVFAINVEAFQFETIETFAFHFVRSGRTMIVLDEATKIKKPTAKRTKRIFKLRAEAGPYSIRAILTGTPLAKNPVDVWALYEFLQPNFFRCTYTNFQYRHAIMTKKKLDTGDGEAKLRNAVINEVDFKIIKGEIDKRKEAAHDGKLNFFDYEELAKKFYLTGYDITIIDESPVMVRFKHLDKLKEAIEPVTISILKSDCADLPPKTYVNIPLTLTVEQKKLIRELSKHAHAIYEGKELAVPQKAVLHTRITQICGGFFAHIADMEAWLEGKASYDAVPLKENPKLNYLLEEISTLDEDYPFIVWAVYRHELDMLYTELSKVRPTSRIYGGLKKEEKETTAENFKKGVTTCLVANPAVAGYGLNFQHAPLQYFYSRNFKVEERLQAEDRSHRLTSKLNVTYKDLFMKGTIESRALFAIKEGREMNDYFITPTLRDIFNVEDERND